MADTRTFFYPATAECAAIISPYPGANNSPAAPHVPNNTMGGYGGLLDVHDYDGSTGNANLFQGPDAVVSSAGIRDLMPVFLASASPGGSESWYLMRAVDFKDWTGVAGIFTRNTDFIMEVDIAIPLLASSGGFRDEAPNLSGPSVSGNSPYGNSANQGSGIALQAIITDPSTHLEVVKDSHIFTGMAGVVIPPAGPLNYARQVIQLNLAAVTPAEMATMVLRVKTEQFSWNGSRTSPYDYTKRIQDSTIYRIGLTPTAGTAAMHSSGKQSATMTSR